MSEVQYNSLIAMQMRANRLARLIDLKAPHIIIFGEFKLIEQAFSQWCQEQGYDPKLSRDEMSDKLGPLDWNKWGDIKQ